MLTQSVPTAKQTFDEFIGWYPENSLVKYELRDGEITEVPRGSGGRSVVSANIRAEIDWELRRLNLPCSIPGQCLLKMPGKNTAYQPDIVVLERSALASESRWKESSIIQNPSSVRLVVELVDEDWETSYMWKCLDYESMGIPEYWIADYQGKPKLEGDGNSNGIASLSVCRLVGEDYQVHVFAGDDVIDFTSAAFPLLTSTINQLFNRS